MKKKPEMDSEKWLAIAIMFQELMKIPECREKFAEMFKPVTKKG